MTSASVVPQSGERRERRETSSVFLPLEPERGLCHISCLLRVRSVWQLLVRPALP